MGCVTSNSGHNFDGDLDHEANTEIFQQNFPTVGYGNFVHFAENSRSC